MKKILLLLFFILTFSNASIPEEFPKLDQRVVDEVGLLSPNVKTDLIKILKTEEEKTSNQIVVVILKSLKGYSIEDVGLELGRYWKIGQKGTNNGILLLVAMDDRKMRIEVGYGLEGALTDVISKEIIEYTLKPNFKAQQYELGILKAVNEIIATMKGEYVNKNYKDTQENDSFFSIPIVLFAMIFFSMIANSFTKDFKQDTFFRFTRALTVSSFLTLISYIISPFVISFLLSDFSTFLAEFLSKYHIAFDGIIFVISFILSFVSAKTRSTNTDFVTTSSSSNSSVVLDSLETAGEVASGIFEVIGGFSGKGGSFGGGGASGSW